MVCPRPETNPHRGNAACYSQPIAERTVRISTLAVSVTTLLPGVPLRRQVNTPPKWSARVEIAISGDGNDTSRVTGWYSEELRRMQGVTIVDSAPDWIIQMVVMETQTQQGVQLGYAISEVTLQRADIKSYFALLSSADTSAVRRSVWQEAGHMTPFSWIIASHKLRVGPTDRLRGAVEDLAAEFDARQLEPSRK